MLMCPKCGAKCSCVDSRPGKRISSNIKLIPERKILRERKYVCRKCGQTHYSQEYLS